MFNDILDKIKNNQINLYSLNDLQYDLSKNIFDMFLENEIFIYKLYSIVKSFYLNKPIIVNKLASLILLNRPLSGNLEVDIPVDSEFIKTILSNYYTLEEYNIEQNFFPPNLIIDFINNLNIVINEYYTNFSNIIDKIKFNEIVSEKSKIDNNIYIVNPYDYVYYEFINTNNSSMNLKKLTKYNIVLYEDSLSLEFHLNTFIKCNKVDHFNSNLYKSDNIAIDFIFLKINFIQDKDFNYRTFSSKYGDILTYNNSYVINSHLSSLILDFIKQRNCIEEINLFRELIINYRDELLLNLTKLKPRTTQALLKKYRNLFIYFKPITSYLSFKLSINSNMFIYSTKDIKDLGKVETSILDLSPYKIKKSLKKFIKLIDNIIYKYIKNPINDEYKNELLDKFTFEFNLNKLTINNINHNENIFNEYLRIYYLLND
ncbi:unknown similar to AMEV033 [Choristoneura rosaceana entomopoxvirus 'L']|uniref:Uncharacterized protein n=1 Tax=Choristoneura rosaceana entomopoxvirus 'L' TaxID=1293539 RepID=A0ABM9QKY4_9POXV|nr:unknown similar to AMEV033 [Choristoneura rosaceana entomopoxvirus 'L']CCU56174.1 unknown similar to AMEV033 [Choristoneura rosaceana entomopoxvirus 'L']